MIFNHERASASRSWAQVPAPRSGGRVRGAARTGAGVTAQWRWILAMGFSALALFGGLVLLFRGGPDYTLVAWILVVIGALSLLVNVVMRDRFVP